MSKEEGAVSSRVCPQCKRLLDVTWKACPYCGKLISRDESPRAVMSRNETTLKVCPHCKRATYPVVGSEAICPYCGSSLTASPSPSIDEFKIEPSSVWYLVPFFFGIIGGLIGYVGTKDSDKNMASNLLIFGIVWNVIWVLIVWIWIISLMH